MEVIKRHESFCISCHGDGELDFTNYGELEDFLDSVCTADKETIKENMWSERSFSLKKGTVVFHNGPDKYVAIPEIMGLDLVYATWYDWKHADTGMYDFPFSVMADGDWVNTPWGCFPKSITEVV